MFDKLNRIISQYLYEWNKIGYQLNDIFSINSDVLKYVSFFFVFVSILIVIFHLWMNYELPVSILLKRVIVWILLIGWFWIYISKIYPDKWFYYVDMDMIEDNGNLTKELQTTLWVNFSNNTFENRITIDNITLSNWEKGTKSFFYIYKPLNVPFWNVVENSLIKNKKTEEEIWTNPIYWWVDNLQLIPYKKGDTYYLKIDEKSVYNPTRRSIIQNLSKMNSLWNDYLNADENTQKEIKELITQLKKETIKLIKLLPEKETIGNLLEMSINPPPTPWDLMDWVINELKVLEGENKKDVSDLIKELNKKYATRRIDISTIFNMNPWIFPSDKLDIKFWDLRIQSYYLNYVKLKDVKWNFSVLSDIKFWVNNSPIDWIVAMSDWYYPLRIGQKNSFFSRVFPEQRDALKSDFYVKNAFFIWPLLFNNVLFLLNFILFFSWQLAFLFIIFSLFPFKKSF